ncbi:hypothetical protein DL98DRAFT_529803 [Cadophora sp. DSE1049]|nr:hypothetical protein DL98DRAFT_529803 [Cadophora sp. DSE1049]
MEDSIDINYICRQCDETRPTGSSFDGIPNDMRVPCDHCFPQGMWRLIGKRTEARARDIRTPPTDPTHYIFDYQCRSCGILATNSYRIRVPGTQLVDDPEPRWETCLNCHPKAMWQVLDFGDQFAQPEVFGSELRQTQATERPRLRNLTPSVQVPSEQSRAETRTLSSDLVSDVYSRPGNVRYQSEERSNIALEYQNQLSFPRLRQHVTPDSWQRCDSNEEESQQIYVLDENMFCEPSSWSVKGDLSLQVSPLNLESLLVPDDPVTDAVDRTFLEQMTTLFPGVHRPDSQGRDPVPHAEREDIPPESASPT